LTPVPSNRINAPAEDKARTLAAVSDPDRLWSLQELAIELGVHARTLRDAARTGRLKVMYGNRVVLDGACRAGAALAIECAFYFDRPRFYERAAQVLKPGGLVVLTDIAFADGAAFLTRRAEDLRRVGTQSSNRTAFERHFRTRSVRRINEHTQPGAQMTVWQILKNAPFSRPSAAERSAWLKMTFYSQLVALGLQVSFIQYDLIVLEKT